MDPHLIPRPHGKTKLCGLEMRLEWTPYMYRCSARTLSVCACWLALADHAPFHPTPTLVHANLSNVGQWEEPTQTPPLSQPAIHVHIHNHSRDCMLISTSLLLVFASTVATKEDTRDTHTPPHNLSSLSWVNLKETTARSCHKQTLRPACCPLLLPLRLCGGY